MVHSLQVLGSVGVERALVQYGTGAAIQRMFIVGERKGRLMEYHAWRICIRYICRKKQ